MVSELFWFVTVPLVALILTIMLPFFIKILPDLAYIKDGVNEIKEATEESRRILEETKNTIIYGLVDTIKTFAQASSGNPLSEKEKKELNNLLDKGVKEGLDEKETEKLRELTDKLSKDLSDFGAIALIITRNLLEGFLRRGGPNIKVS